jgi:hypothetical protein
MLLSISNNFTSNTTILSASVNSNFSTIASWANGNIQQDNLGTFSGAINWTITGNNLALNIASASTTGVNVTALTGILASTKSAYDISSAAVQSTGRALVYLNLSNAASTIDVLQINNAGTGQGLEIISTTQGSIPAPKMTTTQRNAIAAPVTGSRIYNTTTNQPEFYNGSAWAAFYGGATTVDGSTLEVSGTSIRVKDSGIVTAKIADSNVTTAKLADGAVTQAKRAALGQQISSSCGNFSGSSSSYVDVTNLSVSLTTTGRPVKILCIPDGSAAGGYFSASSTAGALGDIFLQVLRDATVVGVINYNCPGASESIQIPAPAVAALDLPAAGTYTYKLQIRKQSGSAYGALNVKLAAYEL